MDEPIRVRELIEQLQKMPPDAEVHVAYDGFGRVATGVEIGSDGKVWIIYDD